MERITITIKPVLLGEIKKLLNMRKSVSKIINEWLEEVLFERKKKRRYESFGSDREKQF